MSDEPKGSPRVNTLLTSASLESGLAVVSTRENWSLGALADAILRTFAEPHCVFVDFDGLRAFGSADATVKTAFQELADAYTPRITVAPAGNGYLQTYSVLSASGWGDESGYFHPTNRRSMSQVVSHFYAPGRLVLVNQDAATISCVATADPSELRQYVVERSGFGPCLVFDLVQKDVTRLTFE